MNKIREFFYWEVIARIQIWWRPVAWILGALVAAAAVVFGAYELAIASPVAKLSLTLGALVIYNLVGEINKRVPHDSEGKLGQVFGLVILVVMLLGVYGLVLSAFIVRWPVTFAIASGFFLAITLVVMEEKKVSIPVQLVWIKNGITIFTYAALVYYLAHYLGLL